MLLVIALFVAFNFITSLGEIKCVPQQTNMFTAVQLRQNFSPHLCDPGANVNCCVYRAESLQIITIDILFGKCNIKGNYKHFSHLYSSTDISFTLIVG